MTGLFSRLSALAIAALAMATLVSRVHAGEICPGDQTGSGCWMCPKSDLMQCLANGGQLENFKKCQQIDNVHGILNCTCEVSAVHAKCWQRGRCCTEYAPTLTAAINVCRLARAYDPSIPRHVVDLFVAKSHSVAEDIWHNDSGLDVPFDSQKVEDYVSLGQVTSTVSYQRTQEQMQVAYPGQGGSFKGNKVTQAGGDSSKAVRPLIQPAHDNQASSSSPDFSAHPNRTTPSTYQPPASPNVYQDSKQTKTGPVSIEQSRDPKLSNLHGSKHHHAKVKSGKLRTVKDCDSDEEKYHLAARSHHGTSLHKRKESWASKHDYHAASFSHYQSSQKCGIDFHGVSYPTPEESARLDHFI